jgi:thioredoxin 1
MANLVAVQDDNFDAEVLKSDVPVLVDFTATWCGPCQALAPTLDAVAAEYDGRVKVVKCDVDNARSSAERFRVVSVPTLLMFKGGEVLGQLIGNQPKDRVAQLIDQAL